MEADTMLRLFPDGPSTNLTKTSSMGDEGMGREGRNQSGTLDARCTSTQGARFEP